MLEIWKKIPGYEDYSVSNLARVKSHERTIIRVNGSLMRVRERILKQVPETYGYLTVKLTKNKVARTERIHKLVAMAFNGHIPRKGIHIDHIDHNVTNNTPSNLQELTHRSNVSKRTKKYTSNYVGVCLHKGSQRWRAAIQVDGKIETLGYFYEEYDAHLAYQKRLKEIL